MSNIKEEISDDNFDDQELEGKIVDYQFSVLPQQEQIDTKPKIEVGGEILEAHKNVWKANSDLVSPRVILLRKTKIKPNKKVFFCKYCDFKTNYKFNYTRHTNKHQRVEPIIKRREGDTKTTKHTQKIVVDSTKIRHTKKKEISFFCKYCEFKTHHKESFKRHIIVHETNKENLPYGCTLCEFKCLDKSYIAKHMIKKHTEQDRDFFCNVCGHRCTSSQNLKKHAVEKHMNNRKFNCDQCDYRANSKRHLNKHKDNIHFKKPYIYKQKKLLCDNCGKKFIGQTKLDIHLLTKHKVDVEVQTYICYICGYKSFAKGPFTVHVRRHSKFNEKMFCANCDYSTCNKANLVQHMVKHNKHIKMHKCNMCSFETKRPHTLRHHVKTHLDA